MNALYSFLYFLVWPFFNLVHPVRVIGRPNIPKGGALICANHTKLSDPVMVAFAVGRKNRLRFMAKAELMEIPVLGWIIAKLGAFGVRRGKSDVGAIKTALKLLKDGERLLLFPEGTRSKDDQVGEAKTGAAMLALRTGVPIVPVYVPRKKNWFWPTTVVIGEAFYPQSKGPKATSEDYRAVADEIMARIWALRKEP